MPRLKSRSESQRRKLQAERIKKLRSQESPEAADRRRYEARMKRQKQREEETQEMAEERRARDRYRKKKKLHKRLNAWKAEQERKFLFNPITGNDQLQLAGEMPRRKNKKLLKRLDAWKAEQERKNRITQQKQADDQNLEEIGAWEEGEFLLNPITELADHGTMKTDTCYVMEEVIEPTSVTLYLKEDHECDEFIRIKEEPFNDDDSISIQEDPIEPKQEKQDDFILDSRISQVASSRTDFDTTLMDNCKVTQKDRNISQQVSGGRFVKKLPCRYTTQSKNIIMNVYEYFGENAPPHTTITEQEKKTAAATKVSVRTIQRIKAAMYRSHDDMIYPPEPPIRLSPVLDNLDDFKRESVRREILSFYERGELPTINKLLNRVKDPPLNFNASRSTLYNLLKNIGFSFRRVHSGRAILMEREDIVATRNKYLREIKKNRENPQPLQEVYLDEIWAIDDGLVKPKLNTRKGPGCIIIHAGGQQGFIPGALLTYKPKIKANCDIHEAIDYEQFKTWFEHQLLPNLQEESLIIMDNALYHTKLLNKEDNNISHDSFTKGELMYNCKQHKEKLSSEIDQLALNHGHTVLRLPQYCCMLNPIKIIWSQVNQRIKNQSSSSEDSLKDIEQITRQAIQEITSEQWQRCIQRIMEIEEDYRAKDRAQNNFFEKFPIDFQSDESSDESSYESMEM